MRPGPRYVALILTGLVAACGPAGPAWLGAEAFGVTVFGRGVVDMGVSALTGRDCSIVRLDRGQTYCAAPDRPATEPYCTRSLGVADCWTSPALLPAPPPSIADTPGPSPAQADYRNARWPRSLSTLP